LVIEVSLDIGAWNLVLPSGPPAIGSVALAYPFLSGPIRGKAFPGLEFSAADFVLLPIVYLVYWVFPAGIGCFIVVDDKD
jgi:hypothetical protein